MEMLVNVFQVLWVLAALLWRVTGDCIAMHGWLLESSYVLCLVADAGGGYRARYMPGSLSPSLGWMAVLNGNCLCSKGTCLTH